MVAMVTWMCFMLYTAGFIQQVFQIDEIAKFHEKLQDPVSWQKSRFINLFFGQKSNQSSPFRTQRNKLLTGPLWTV